jgi:hypothetical protein
VSTKTNSLYPQLGLGTEFRSKNSAEETRNGFRYSAAFQVLLHLRLCKNLGFPEVNYPYKDSVFFSYSMSNTAILIETYSHEIETYSHEVPATK